MNTKITNFLIVFCIFQLIACSQKSQERDKLAKESIDNFNSNRYSEALISFDKLIKLDSNNYMSWFFRGRTLILLNRNDEALLSFNKTQLLNPNYYETYHYRAMIYNINGHPEKSLNDINIAINGKMNDTNLILLRAGYYLNCNKFDSAIIDCNFLIKLNPKNADALYYRSTAFEKLGNLEKAVTDLNNAIDINPNDPDILNYRGSIFITQEKYKLAIQDCIKSIQLIGVNNSITKAYSYNNLSFCQYKNNDFDEALKNVNISIQLLPSNSFAFKNRALIYLAMNKNSQACNDLDESLRLGFTEIYGNEVLNLKSKYCK